MKIYLFALLCFLSSAAIASNSVDVRPQKATVYVNFPKLKDSIAIFSYLYFDNQGKMVQNNDQQIQNGEFSISTAEPFPIKLRIFLNNKELTFDLKYYSSEVLLLPGDSIVLDVSDYGYENIISSGKGSAKIKYRKLYMDKIREARQANLKNATVGQHIDNLESQFQFSEQVIDILQKELSEDEKKVLRAYTLLNGYYDFLRFIYIQNLKLNSSDMKSIKARILEDKRFIETMGWRKDDVSTLVSGYEGLFIYAAYLKQSINDGEFYDSTKSIKANYQLLKEHYMGKDILDKMLAIILYNQYKKNKFSQEFEECYQDYLANYDSEIVIAKILIEAYSQHKRQIKQTVDVSNLSFTNIRGQNVKLSDFRGKVLVLDFWFNGCGGCALITPYLEKVEETLKTNKDIVFVSISVDKAKEKWLRGIGQFTPKNSVQLYTSGKGVDHEIMKSLGILALPVLAIIDKKGRVHTSQATRPTTDVGKQKFIQEIESAL